MLFRSLLLLASYLLCSGFTLSPMSQSINLADKQKQAQFFVENNSNEPMPILINVYKRVQKIDGKEDMPETSDLQVFPPQLIVPSKQKRAIRVTWKGEATSKELAYRLVAEQLPLDVSKTKKKASGIKMLLKYVAALYVDPGDTKANLQVVSVKNDNKNLLVTIKNKGNHHAPLINPTLTIKGKEDIKLTNDQLKGLAGENILGETTRLFNIPTHPKVISGSKGIISLD